MKPVYRTRFSIDKTVSLDRILESTKDWMVYMGVGSKESLSEFNRGMDVKLEDSHVETKYEEDSGKKNFVMRWTFPDRSDEQLIWVEDVGVVRREDNVNDVEISVANGLEHDVIKPVQSNISRPGLVPLLINNFPCFSDYGLSTKPRVVTENNVDRVIDMIYDAQRKLPLIFASAGIADDSPLIDVGLTAKMLSGLAHVFHSADHKVTLQTRDSLGRDMGCWNGAVRIYWPSVNSGSGFHKYWNGEKIREVCTNKRGVEDKKRFSAMLFELVAGYSVSGNSLISLEDIARMQLNKRIAVLREAGNYQELALAYADENDLLRREVSGLKQNDSSKESIVYSLRERIKGLEAALERRKNGDDEPVFEIKNVYDAVQKAKKDYSDDVVITPKAEDGARKCLYKNPEQVLKFFGWLSETYVPSRRGEARVNDLTKSCLDDTGFTYVSSQSEKTMGEFPGDYMVTHEGVKYELREHVGKGVSHDGRNTVRIAFDYADKLGKAVVGFIGQHQRTRVSN